MSVMMVVIGMLCLVWGGMIVHVAWLLIFSQKQTKSAKVLAQRELLELMRRTWPQARRYHVRNPKSEIRNPKPVTGWIVSLQAFQDAVSAWQRETFKKQDLGGKLTHLVREANELAEKPLDITEWADVLILYLGAAAQRGLSVDDLFLAARLKFEAVKQRKSWELQPDGSYHHVEVRA